MIVVLKCEAPQGVQLTSLNISMKYGDVVECPKRVYDFNRELQNLCGMGIISARPKLAPNSAPVDEAPSPPPPPPPPPAPPAIDLDLLAAKLLEKLGGALSVDAIAQAVAQKLPQGVGGGMVHGRVAPMGEEEPLTFIPNQILTEDSKMSSQSLSDSVIEPEDISEALKALRAMRKG